nr:hypothetical protein BgiMline_029536 [Biomphalaria glabrata]
MPNLSMSTTSRSMSTSSTVSTSEATGSTATLMNKAPEDISFSRKLKLSETVFDIPKFDNSERNTSGIGSANKLCCTGCLSSMFWENESTCG